METVVPELTRFGVSKGRGPSEVLDLEYPGYFDLYASQAPPLLLGFGPPPEINFLDVLDDLEQKKKF